MSDGQLIFSNAGPTSSQAGAPPAPQQLTNATLNASYILLDAHTSTNAGKWVQMYPYSRGTLEVVHTGAGGSYSVQLEGSNAPTKPADATAGSNLGSAIVSDSITFFQFPVRWIKAAVTISAGPTVTARLNVVAP